MHNTGSTSAFVPRPKEESRTKEDAFVDGFPTDIGSSPSAHISFLLEVYADTHSSLPHCL